MSETPYISSEDSALLRKALVRYSGERCLEIGVGNGGNLLTLSKRFNTVLGTDLVRPTMADWKGDSNLVIADGASCVRGSSFDLVTFNPPYVADDESGDATVEGGRGLEVPRTFLEEALRVVKRSGVVLFLLNQDAELGDFEMICNERGFGLRPILTERLFFEELSVYEATSIS
jgi:methylase of polypeptide subunit release factors